MLFEPIMINRMMRRGSFCFEHELSTPFSKTFYHEELEIKSKMCETLS